MKSDSYEIAIIGGGIVGMATAMALSHSKRKLVVLEAENQIAAHQTGNNSGVIHSGLYYRPGSLKARNCVTGRKQLYQFCQEYKITHEKCGKLVVATDENEIPALRELERRGKENGLHGLKWLQSSELSEYEPHVSGLSGLLVPETGIVDFIQVTQTYGRLVQEAGGEIKTNTKFLKLTTDTNNFVLETNQGEIRCNYLVNCGGLYSDRIAKKCGLEPGVKIIPFRGEYYEIVSERNSLVRNLIYPVPNPKFPFLGVHFTRMIHGGREAGPNAVLAFKRDGYKKTDFSAHDSLEVLAYSGFWKLAVHYWRTGIGEFHRSLSKKAFVKALQRLIPDIQQQDVHPAGAGVRAQAVDTNGNLVDDFRIVTAKNMIHVLNAPSPAATASISIGQTIASVVEDHFGLD